MFTYYDPAYNNLNQRTFSVKDELRDPSYNGKGHPYCHNQGQSKVELFNL